MKKILLISNMYPNNKYPSYGTFVRNTVNQLEENKDFLITKIVLFKYSNKVIKFFHYIFFNIKILCFCLLGKYDTIYGHYISHISLPLSVVMKIKKINLVINIHGSDITKGIGIEHRTITFTRFVLKNCDKIVVPSPYFKDKIIKDFGINGNKIFVYPSGGIDLSIFKPADNKKNFFDKKSIAYISRIDEGKGWDLFINAILYAFKLDPEIFDKINFMLIGSGARTDNLTNIIKKSKLENKVLLIDSQPQNSLAKIISTLDWVVIPSELEESLGLIGIESMACGVPIIGTDFAGISSYLVNEYNGFSFDRSDYRHLAQRILQSATIDKKTYEEIVDNSLFTASEYSKEKCKEIIWELMG